MKPLRLTFRIAVSIVALVVAWAVVLVVHVPMSHGGYQARITNSTNTAATGVWGSGGHFSGTSAGQTVTSSTNNVVVPYPSGTAAGDLVLLVIVNGASQNSTVGSTGWTQLANPNLGGSNMELQAWWHSAGAETSVTLSQLHTNSSGASVWTIDYKNLPGAVTAGISSGTSASATSLTPANLTTTGANATVISLVGINVAHTLTLSTPRSFTARTTPTSPAKALGVADRFVAAAGSVPSPTWTESTAASQWAYITVAFR